MPADDKSPGWKLKFEKSHFYLWNTEDILCLRHGSKTRILYSIGKLLFPLFLHRHGPKQFFTSANPNILPWYLLLFPLSHSFPNVNLTSSTPMRSSTMQEVRQSWSNKVKGVGYGENNIRDGKFKSAWVSIINFFSGISRFGMGPK